MIFVDEAIISVKSGDGGNGCESFYRDLFMRYPRPDGGDGGKGGDVIFIAEKGIHTLLDFKYKQHFVGKKGGHGSSKNKKGKVGADCILRVPVGTIIRDAETKLLIRDLTEDKQSVIVAKGAKGGRGNSNNRTPLLPEKGQEARISLELKLIADVGLVGFPNAGKSTIISNISRVRSKIANYPFTTKQPILGFVEGDDFSFVVADLPGIIEGAHKGKGLGDRFLRHAERTKMLVHVVDMSGFEGRDPVDDYNKLNHELYQYSDSFGGKQKLIVANKMDLPDAEKNLKKFKKKIPGKILAVSALEKTGLNELVDEIRQTLCLENSQDQ